MTDRIEGLEEREKTKDRLLVEYEKRMLRLMTKVGEPLPANGRLLPKELWEASEREEAEEKQQHRGWFSWLPWSDPRPTKTLTSPASSPEPEATSVKMSKQVPANEAPVDPQRSPKDLSSRIEAMTTSLSRKPKKDPP